ncbi:MAG: cell division protein FtsZ [Fimbriimonadales bacterium]
MQQRGLYDVQASIKVFGIGGGGCNAVERMIGANVAGVEFVALNTDVQTLARSSAPTRLPIGQDITRGLGTGGNPEIGREAAEAAEREIRACVAGVDMAFVTCGMGGGTGSGAAPVVARICREERALTVAVVTKPFTFEGPKRCRNAEAAVAELRDSVDTIICVPNDRLLDVVSKTTTLNEAFGYADDVLRQAVQSITDIVLVPGVINVDFADVRSIMSDAGPAMMGIGHGRGDNKAMDAASRAVSSPLLERSIEGASRVLVNLTGGEDLTLGEANDAMSYIQEFVDPDDGNIIMGHVCDPAMEGQARVIVLAAGLPRHGERDGGFRLEQHMRQAQAAATQAEAPRVNQPAEEETIDIPSFLRRYRQ